MTNTFFKIAAPLLAVTALAAGCANGPASQVRRDIDQVHEVRRKVVDVPVQPAPVFSRVTEVPGTLIPVGPVVASKSNEWLKKIRVSLEIRNALPLSVVMDKFSAQGVNFVSDLPLDTFAYSGKLNPTDADTALKVVLGSVGLDFEPDDLRKLVVIKPMSSRTWYLNIGKRKASFSTSGAQQSGASAQGSTTSPFAGGAAPGSPPAGGVTSTPAQTMSALGMPGAGASTATAAAAPGGTVVSAADDFWTSLTLELTNRLSVLMPRPTTAAGGQSPLPSPIQNVPPRPPGADTPPPVVPAVFGGAQGENQPRRQIGSFSINPETGAITVQAPHWVLSDLDGYIKRVQDMYNTDITFMGELVLVTSTRTDSEGFDLAAFTSWAAGRYGAVASNNALGGVTVTLPAGAGGPSVVAGAQAVGGALLGLQYRSATDALQIFNAYLAELGQVSVVQRPLITTTSGVPGLFSKKLTDYYNTVSQQAAAGGTGSAATATQNTLVPVDLGMDLQINPRVDISTGLIRAQLTLNQSIQSSTRTIPQTITFGSNTATINTTIPIITKENISGEVLLRDGDLIVVGGQTEESLSADENGLPGKDAPIGGLFGVKKASRSKQTHYFALRVAVNQRK